MDLEAGNGVWFTIIMFSHEAIGRMHSPHIWRWWPLNATCGKPHSVGLMNNDEHCDLS